MRNKYFFYGLAVFECLLVLIAGIMVLGIYLPIPISVAVSVTGSVLLFFVYDNLIRRIPSEY